MKKGRLKIVVDIQNDEDAKDERGGVFRCMYLQRLEPDPDPDDNNVNMADKEKFKFRVPEELRSSGVT